MRKIVFALTGTVSGLILLFSYHTSLAGAGALAVPASTGTTTKTVPGAGASTPTPAPTSSGSRATGRPRTSSGSAGSTSAKPRAAGPTTEKVTGSTAQTQWGPVQVQITVRGGRITDATAVQYPNGNGHDAAVNSYALPVLAREVVRAQSAQIDLVSGATITSVGYVQSLQSALDRAHL